MRISAVVILAAAGLAIAATATGITYAASSGGAVQACANSKGTLALLNAHGHCPDHYSKVSISQRGPQGNTGKRGKTGKTGKTGRRGKRGPAGPGATSLHVQSTTTLVTTESDPIAGTGLTVEVLCDPTNNAQVYVNLDHAGAPFAFEGTGSYLGMGAGSLLYQNPTNPAEIETQDLSEAAAQVSASQLGDVHSVEFTATSGTVAATIVVAQDDKMFTVQLGAFHSDDVCWSHAIITPAG